MATNAAAQNAIKKRLVNKLEVETKNRNDPSHEVMKLHLNCYLQDEVAYPHWCFTGSPLVIDWCPTGSSMVVN